MKRKYSLVDENQGWGMHSKLRLTVTQERGKHLTGDGVPKRIWRFDAKNGNLG